MSRMSLAPGRAREYETIFILRPTVDKEAVDAITQRTADVVKAEHGHLTEMELWGRRRLAYSISRHYRGVYVYLKFMGRGNLVAELERQLRLADNVIRYQTIVLRNNVAFEGTDLPETQVDLEAELPPEPDEPEMTRERELGLDTPFPDRGRGRHDRYRDDRGGPPRAPAGEAKAGEAKAGEAKAGEAKASDAKASPAPDAGAEKASAPADKAEDKGKDKAEDKGKEG